MPNKIVPFIYVVLVAAIFALGGNLMQVAVITAIFEAAKHLSEMAE